MYLVSKNTSKNLAAQLGESLQTQYNVIDDASWKIRTLTNYTSLEQLICGTYLDLKVIAYTCVAFLWQWCNEWFSKTCMPMKRLKKWQYML